MCTLDILFTEWKMPGALSNRQNIHDGSENVLRKKADFNMKMEYLETFYVENKALWYKQNFLFTTYVSGMWLTLQIVNHQTTDFSCEENCVEDVLSQKPLPLGLQLFTILK